MPDFHVHNAIHRFSIRNIQQTLTYSTRNTFPFRSVSTQKVLNKATSSTFFRSDLQNCLLFRKDYFSIRVDLLCFRMHHCNSSFENCGSLERNNARFIFYSFFPLKSFIFIFQMCGKNAGKSSFRIRHVPESLIS